LEWGRSGREPRRFCRGTKPWWRVCHGDGRDVLHPLRAVRAAMSHGCDNYAALRSVWGMGLWM